MKKFLFLFLALFAMTFFAKAQYLLQEGFEATTLPSGWTIIDSDGDGYNWDASYWITTYDSQMGHNGGNCISSASYIDGVGALNPSNWLITPQINLIANSTLTFWLSDFGYPETYSVLISTTTTNTSAFTTILETGTTSGDAEFEQFTIDLSNYTGGQVYIAFHHHNSYNNYWLLLDDVEIFAQPTNPTLMVNPTSLTMPAQLGLTASTSVQVDGYNLTSAITATTAAPFEVSADGTTYATTASLAQTGGTLYVRYTPTTAGIDNGTVTLTSGTATASITLTGTAVDCNVSLPYTETFNATSASRNCWTLVSNNTENVGGTYGMGFVTVDNREVLRFSSYSTATDYNQYAFSPLLNVSSSATNLSVNITYATYNTGDNLYFGYITPTDTIWDPTSYQSNDFETLNFIIPASATQLAIHYYGNYAWRAWVDEVSVTELTSEYCYPVSNLTASGVTAHEAILTWSGDANNYTIYDLSDTSVVVTVNDTTYTLTGLASDSLYSFGVVANCTSSSSNMVAVNLQTLISCPVPTGISIVLTPGNGTVATLSWTENGTATAWQICLNGDETNLIDVNTNTSYNLTGLTPEQVYTAKVRANCGANDQSVWSSTTTFTPTNAYVLTVNIGTATNNYVPIYGYYADEFTKSQFIIPAADLTTMQFGTINKLTFYASQSDVNWGDARFNVYLIETNETTLSELADYSSMTLVYADSLSIVNNTMEVNFTNPFLYTGSNLLIGFQQTIEGTWSTSTWYGISATGASMGGYNNSVSQRNFLPKTTFAFTPGVAPTCLPINNLIVSNITAHTAILNWQGEANSYIIYNLSDTSVVDTVNGNTYTLTGLTSNSQHSFGVVANCGNEVSIMRTITFTTLISCPVPTDLAVVLTPGNATIATLNWHENGSASAWQICLNGDETNLINVTDTTYIFTGLTPEQAYTAKVRAICDTNDHSVWSTLITFTPTNEYSITVNDGTNFNAYVPIWGLYVDELTTSQLIIPATDLTTIQYGSITKLTFYASQSNVNWGAASFNVYVTETNETTLSELADYSTMTQVYAGSLSINDNTMEVSFTNPYLYMGGNLMIGFDQTIRGTYVTSYWYGVSANGASLSGYNGSADQRHFLPKTTIAYTPGTGPSCLPVDGLTVDTTTANSVTISWTGTAASYDIYNDSTLVGNTTSNTYTITGLNAATAYTFGVQAICSATDVSVMSTISAMTDIPPTSDTLTVTFAVNNATMGTTTPTPGTYQYVSGDTVIFSATPNAGYHFVGWEWAIGPDIDTLGINYLHAYFPAVDLISQGYSNMTFTALFEASSTPPTQYTVTLNTADANMGTVSPAGATTVDENSSFTATATAVDGYRFVNWTNEAGTEVSSANPYTFTVTENVSLIANFELIDAIEDVTLAQSLSLMPNPADNYIELNINSNVDVKEAVVFNAFGQMIQTLQLNNNHARIDLSNVASGMYFVRVNGEGVSATKKFIKR